MSGRTSFTGIVQLFGCKNRIRIIGSWGRFAPPFLARVFTSSEYNYRMAKHLGILEVLAKRAVLGRATTLGQVHTTYRRVPSRQDTSSRRFCEQGEKANGRTPEKRKEPDGFSLMSPNRVSDSAFRALLRGQIVPRLYKCTLFPTCALLTQSTPLGQLYRNYATVVKKGRRECIFLISIRL